MRGQHYENNDAVQETMHTWLQSSGMNFYHSGIFKLMQHWQKYMDYSGNLVEKW